MVSIYSLAFVSKRKPRSREVEDLAEIDLVRAVDLASILTSGARATIVRASMHITSTVVLTYTM